METERAANARDRSIPELLSDLATETATLVRSEMQLARVELTEKIKPVEKSAGYFGATALFGAGAFAAITTCLIALIALVLQVWAAALIVAVVYAAIAVAFAQNGRRQLAAMKPPLLPETVATVREDVAWTKALRKSGKT